jgi:hypothetical protein
MKNDQTKPEKSHPHSELLEGTRPANDAKLIRDILNAGCSPQKSLTDQPMDSALPSIVTRKPSSVHNFKPITSNGATAWDGSS